MNHSTRKLGLPFCSNIRVPRIAHQNAHHQELLALYSNTTFDIFRTNIFGWQKYEFCKKHHSMSPFTLKLLEFVRDNFILFFFNTNLLWIFTDLCSCRIFVLVPDYNEKSDEIVSLAPECTTWTTNCPFTSNSIEYWITILDLQITNLIASTTII